MWQIPLLALGGYGALVVHELGHLLAARVFGLNALTVTIGLGPIVAGFSDRSGTFWAFKVLPVRSTCGFYDGSRTPQPKSDEALKHLPSICRLTIAQRAGMLIAGPATNIALGSALLLATYIWDPNLAPAHLGRTGSEIPLLVGAFSLSLGLFNLLPIPPLDGGRLILLAIEALWGDAIQAQTEKRLSAIGAILLATLGFLATVIFGALLL